MKTVNLGNLPKPTPTKMFAQVVSGAMTMSAYHKELETHQGVTAGWVDPYTYVIDTGKGIKDPNPANPAAPQWLSTLEYVEVFKSLLPTPLESAGKVIRLRGPVAGTATGLVARICYAATIEVEVLTPGIGMIDVVTLEKLAIDKVRLVNPDTRESTRRVGHRLWCETSQLKYKRSQGQPSFDFTGVLDLHFIETHSPWGHSRVRLQVKDKNNYFAWINDPSDLQDVT